MAYIVVATTNAHKVDEYRKLLEGQKVELKSLLDYPAFPGVEETGKTFRENAGIKALAACKYCDFSSVCGRESMPGTQVPSMKNSEVFEKMREEDSDGV